MLLIDMETTPLEETANPIKRRTPTQRHKGSPLNEQDWVDAAIGILVNENVRGIRIEVLCKKLGVTKGSFYWHFATRNDLLMAVLSSWRRRMTLDVIHKISSFGNSPTERLQKLISLPRQPKSPASAQVEMSVRDWARRVKMPKDAVAEVDKIRMDYFVQLLNDAGFEGDDARGRAYIIYCVMMGDSILHQSLSEMPHDDFLKIAMETVLRPTEKSQTEDTV
ncbi:MAG: AcrR family transcriptional regulator [Celeribacter sp.]|jgi:AcrR family transcriptional regulator